MIKRCPKCGATTDNMYGFCIRCGYEFPKMENDNKICSLCQYENPDEAEYCVKCGTPLFLKRENVKEVSIKPIVIQKEVIKQPTQPMENKTSSWLIIFGYIFSILGGILGLIIAIYLSTRKDPVARKHGHVQLAIFLFYALIIVILYVTGNFPQDILNQYQQMLRGNLTMFQR